MKIKEKRRLLSPITFCTINLIAFSTQSYLFTSNVGSELTSSDKHLANSNHTCWQSNGHTPNKTGASLLPWSSYYACCLNVSALHELSIGWVVWPWMGLPRDSKPTFLMVKGCGRIEGWAGDPRVEISRPVVKSLI